MADLPGNSEAKVTKSVARYRIHVERANARLKDFNILNFVPPYLRCYMDKVFQLCAALVNLQFTAPASSERR